MAPHGDHSELAMRLIPAASIAVRDYDRLEARCFYNGLATKCVVVLACGCRAEYLIASEDENLRPTSIPCPHMRHGVHVVQDANGDPVRITAEEYTVTAYGSTLVVSA